MNRKPGTLAVGIGVLTATIPTLMLFLAVTYLFIMPLVLGIICILLGIKARRSAGSLSRRVGWIAALIAIVAVVVPFGMISYASRSGPPVCFVLPDGYRGTFRLIVDKEKGVDIPLQDKRYVYQISQSGVLLIKDDGPFRQWHSTSAIYSNGQSLSAPHLGPLTQNDAVLLRSSGSSTTHRGKEELHFFVGTKAEFEAGRWQSPRKQ